MPAQRPRAAFEPISPDLDIQELLDSSSNFEVADRIHCDALDEYGLEKFGELVALHVVDGGKPLIVEGFNERLDSSVFSEKWLRTHHGKKSKSWLKLFSITLVSDYFLLNNSGKCSKPDYEVRPLSYGWSLP